MYHVKCFEELLLSSARYVIRFEPNRDHHFPDRGAQDILAEYISRWRSRIEQASKALNKPVKPKYVVSASNLHFQLDSNNELGPEAELSPALKEVKTPNVWAIADEIWERRRQILAEHFEEDNKIFGLFPKRPHVDKPLSMQLESTPTCACADELQPQTVRTRKMMSMIWQMQQKATIVRGISQNIFSMRTTRITMSAMHSARH